MWRKLGFKSLDDFLVNFWEQFFVPKDPNNLLCMLSTWSRGNIGNTPGFDGDLEKALASIKVLPGLPHYLLQLEAAAVHVACEIPCDRGEASNALQYTGHGVAAEHPSLATSGLIKQMAAVSDELERRLTDEVSMTAPSEGSRMCRQRPW